jgi:hypothetical protein
MQLWGRDGHSLLRGGPLRACEKSGALTARGAMVSPIAVQGLRAQDARTPAVVD